MFLVIRFFDVNDFWVVPVCILALFLILRNRVNNTRDTFLKKLYYKAFYFRIIMVFLYVIITEFYFGGGDTALYYQGVKDLQTAILADANNIPLILQTSSLKNDNPLSPYFIYDSNDFDSTYGYMKSPANFFMPRLGLIFAILFFGSYICICLCFAFFAMGGAIRLFKTFYHFYPSLKRELSLAIIFLPSVAFWSSGLLKDTICFGCVGFFVYAILNIFIKKTKYASSFLWLIISSYLLYTIKVYIFLVLLLAMTIWIFSETNQLIKEKTLRQIFTLMTFAIGIVIGFFLLQYFTSANTLQQYQLENIVSSAEYQRRNYQAIDQMTSGAGSYYEINTSNPFLLVLNSIVATFFRPFLWEVKSAAAALSAIEALTFLILTVHLIFSKKGARVFRLIFKDSRILMCFIFAVVFAIGVGSSTANFGALSRYKIPCMPFYMVMLLLLYKETGLKYPRWFKWILKKTT